MSLRRAYKRSLLWARGQCAWEGCEEPAMRWFDYCDAHMSEHMRVVGAEIEQERFDYDVAVHTAALRRVAAASTQEGEPNA